MLDMKKSLPLKEKGLFCLSFHGSILLVFYGLFISRGDANLNYFLA